MNIADDQQDKPQNPGDTTPVRHDSEAYYLSRANYAFQLVEPLVERYLNAYYFKRFYEGERGSILGVLDKLRSFLGEELYVEAVYDTCELFRQAHQSDVTINESDYPPELGFDAGNHEVLDHPRPSNS